MSPSWTRRKSTAAPALKALADHGVAVKVLTGDNELVTARSAARSAWAYDKVLLGPEVERMSDAELAQAAGRTTSSPS